LAGQNIIIVNSVKLVNYRFLF